MSGKSMLVLSASTGNGHVSAAEAIVGEACQRGWRAKHVDVLDHVTPAFRKWYRGGYEVLVRKKPGAWGHLYRTSDKKRFNYYFQTALDTGFCQRLEKVVKEYGADWVVCTHSLPQPALAGFQKRLGFKTGVVVTDLYVHRMWLRGAVDVYFVPQPWSKEVLERRLPEFGGKIEVTGIPVNSVFAAEVEQGAAREGVKGLVGDASEEVWVMVTSGGIGGGPLVDASLALGGLPVRVVVVCGRNVGMKDEVSAATMGMANVSVLGAVSQAEMAALMQASDLLVSKPGGLTTFEALTAGVPFVVYWPFLIPGQEEGNAEFLESAGAGVVVRRKDDLAETVERLLRDPELRRGMAVKARANAQPEATKKIVDFLDRER